MIWLQVLSLSCPFKGRTTRLFLDFPEIGALTADPKQDQNYDFLKTCLNNEVANRPPARERKGSGGCVCGDGMGGRKKGIKLCG